MSDWNSASTHPTKKGWYEVRRIDDSAHKTMVRAWGNDQWWTPLPDGWLSGPNDLGEGKLAPLYEWRDGPICGMEPSSSNLTPIEEMERAKARRADNGNGNG